MQTAYRMGKWVNKIRPLVIKLLDPNDITPIFEHLPNLKGKKNQDKKHISVSEHRTSQAMEKRKRNREIKEENRRLPLSHAAEVEIKSGEIFVDSVKYEKQVEPPAARQIFLASKEEKHEFRNAPFCYGDEVAKNGSKFTSYAAEVEDFNQVKAVYKRIKEDNLSATHILCAYRIYGKQLHILQDFSDDGEWGGGRHILDVLKKLGVYNIAVFVVRVHDGPNLGKDRFDIIKKLTESALLKMKGVLNYGQRLPDKPLLSALKKAAAKPHEGTRKSERLARNRSGSQTDVKNVDG